MGLRCLEHVPLSSTGFVNTWEAKPYPRAEDSLINAAAGTRKRFKKNTRERVAGGRNYLVPPGQNPMLEIQLRR